MHYCSVPGCSNRSDKVHNISFCRFPAPNSNLCNIWMINTRIKHVTKNTRVCSEHFEGGKRDDLDAIPTVFPWSAKRRKPPMERPLGPVRARKTTLQHIRKAITHDHSYCITTLPSTMLTSLYEIPTSDIPLLSTSDYILSDPSSASTPPTSNISTPPTSNIQTHTPFRIENIMHDQHLVHFYTGFADYDALQCCFKFLGSSVYQLYYWYGSKNTSQGSKITARSLTPINEFFLVMCRLRLGLLEEDIAYRFNISQSTVSRVCTTWINLLYHKFIESRKYQFGHLGNKLMHLCQVALENILILGALWMQQKSLSRSHQVLQHSSRHLAATKTTIRSKPL